MENEDDAPVPMLPNVDFMRFGEAFAFDVVLESLMRLKSNFVANCSRLPPEFKFPG